MSFYSRLLKKVQLEQRLSNAIKEISLDDLAEVYYKMTHKYRGYDEITLSRLYFNDPLYLQWIKTFEEFINYFKMCNYKII